MDAVNQDPQTAGSTNPTTEEQHECDSRSYWEKWIKAAKKGADKHWQDAKAAWREYKNEERRAEGANAVDNQAPLCYPIYWSSCKTLEPAYYCRTPKITTRRKFGIGDNISVLASTLYERRANYLTESSDFDVVLMDAVKDLIHADKTTTQVIYEADLVDVEDNQPLSMLPPPEAPQEASEDMLMIRDPNPEPQYLLPDGTVHEGEVKQNPDGSYFAPGVKQVAQNQRVYLAPVCFDEVIHTPEAKNQSEIKDIAFYFCMSKYDALRRFSGISADQITWKKKTEQDKEVSLSMPGDYLEGWEIYCSRTKKTYWYSEQYQVDFLDQKPDQYKLKKFFPCPPFIINSKPNKSMYPTPAFQQLAPAITQLHSLYQKVFNLITAIRRRALVDDSEPALLNALNDLDSNEYIGCKNLASILEKGGIANMVLFIPVQELVQALGEIQDIKNEFKNDFNEFFGVPDILRGVSDPIETAEAQGIKTSAAHDRFKFVKKQVGQLARDSIEMMVDLATELFEPQTLADIDGMMFLTQEQQALYPEACALLKNDDQRLIRLEIDTDSMAFIDQGMRAQQMNAVAQTVINGLKESANMLQIDPEFAKAAMQTVLATLENLELGKDFVDTVKGAVNTLMQSKMTAQPPPPPPDYEGLKVKLADQQQQIDASLKSRELDQRQTQMDRDEMDREFQRQVEEIRLGFEARNTALEEKLEQFNEIIQTQTNSIEAFKAQMNAAESAAEERRLAQEAEMQALKETTIPAEPVPAPPPVIVQAPPVTIHNYPAPTPNPTPSTKITNMTKDPITGNTRAVTTEIPLVPPPTGSIG